MLDIKYSHPHTFYVSAGIVLMSLGAYPLYLYDFIWSQIPKFKLAFLVGLVIIGIISLWYGENLWKKKEEERKEMFEIRKAIMQKENELKQLEIDAKRIASALDDGKPKKALEQSERELREKQLEVEKEIYVLKEKELKRATPASGAIVVPFISGIQPNPNQFGSDVNWFSPGWNVVGLKQCSICKNNYNSTNPADGYICPNCASKHF